MVGIVSYGSYIPSYRLPRDVIAKEWDTPSLGGERALASFDEDSLTLAMNASIDALGERNPKEVAGIFFASTTSPYREKQAAATVATVLDTAKELRTMDFTDSLRAGTSALLTALDLAKAGELFLVCAGDARMGEPDTIQEQNYGDAGGALVIGSENVIAELVGTHTVSQEFIGTWRTEEQDYLKSFPGGFENKFGYNRFYCGNRSGSAAKMQSRSQGYYQRGDCRPHPESPAERPAQPGIRYEEPGAGNILEYGWRRRDRPTAGPAGRGA